METDLTVLLSLLPEITIQCALSIALDTLPAVSVQIIPPPVTALCQGPTLVQRRK